MHVCVDWVGGWGVLDSSTLNSGHNRSLKAWNNLTKRKGFVSTDYHRTATQATNEAVNPPPIPVVKEALFWTWTATIWTEVRDSGPCHTATT